MEVDEGEPATLEIWFVSDAPTTVSWFKDMKPVEDGRRVKIITDENSSKVVIKKTGVEDEGLYRCTLQSADQELSSSAELIVEGMCVTFVSNTIYTLFTLEVPRVANINFFLAMYIDNQEKRL